MNPLAECRCWECGKTMPPHQPHPTGAETYCSMQCRTKVGQSDLRIALDENFPNLNWSAVR